MNSKTCRHARQEIDESEIGQALSEVTTAHLASCAPCAQFRSERASLRELIGGLEPVVAPADFDMRLRARIARDGSGAEPQPFFARFIGMPAIAAASVAVLAVALAVIWVGQGNHQTTTAGMQSPPVPASRNPEIVVQSAPVSTDAAVSPGSKENVAVVKSFTGRRNRSSVRSGGATDYGLSAANSVKRGDSFVDAPSKPVVVSLEDNNGAKRKISLPPVSFGAQSLVDNRIPVSYTGNSRVW
jgi:anti-sigma factor RsiW